ncbi:MAG TPA: GNAT family N-acetyltransferase [Caulobacteraceae bacterium]
MIALRDDAFPTDGALGDLLATAWPAWRGQSFAAILARSLAHVCAFEDERLVGYVNVATDGGVHAFILDTCVHPDFQRNGLGTALVRRAAKLARNRGAEWLHVDHEAHLAAFYAACGFRPAAGAALIDLTRLETEGN